MIEGTDQGLAVRGPMVMENARQLLVSGRAGLRGNAVVDFSAVEVADSSALAVMLGWLRHAEAGNHSLTFVGVPAGVVSLAELYGVSDLLPLA